MSRCFKAVAAALHSANVFIGVYPLDAQVPEDTFTTLDFLDFKEAVLLLPHGHHRLTALCLAPQVGLLW